MRELLEIKLNQDKSIKAFLSVASENIADCHSRLLQLNEIDVERFNDSLNRQVVVISSFLSTASERSAGCCARLEKLSTIDSLRFTKESKEVAALLSSLEEKAAACWKRLETLNELDSARFIEKKQAEALEIFLSLSDIYTEHLTDQEAGNKDPQRLSDRETESKNSTPITELLTAHEQAGSKDSSSPTDAEEMSRVRAPNMRGKQQQRQIKAKKGGHHQSSQQEGWKEENIYANVDAITENHRDSNKMQITGSLQPEGYILQTSPPAVGSTVEDDQKEPIYENLKRNSVSESLCDSMEIEQSLPAIKIHAQPYNDTDDIMVSSAAVDIVPEEDDLEQSEDIYENTVTPTTSSTSITRLDPVEEIEELYDNAVSLMVNHEEEAEYSCPNHFPQQPAVKLNPRLSGYTRFPQPSNDKSQPPPKPRRNFDFNDNSDLYEDVDTALMKGPFKIKPTTVVQSGRVGEGVSSGSHRELEAEEENDFYIPMEGNQDGLDECHSGSEEDENFYELEVESADSLDNGLNERASVSSPAHSPRRRQQSEEKVVATNLLSTGNSPLDHEDYDDALFYPHASSPNGMRSPRKISPVPSTPPTAHRRSLTTRLVKPPPKLGGQRARRSLPADYENVSHGMSPSSSNSSIQFPGPVRSSRILSTENEVFVPESSGVQEYTSPSQQLRKRTGRRRSGLKAKSTSSVASIIPLQARKTSSPQIRGDGSIGNPSYTPKYSKKPLTKQVSEPIRSGRAAAAATQLSPNMNIRSNMPLPPLPTGIEDNDYDYAVTNVGPVSLYEVPKAQPYTPPLKRASQPQMQPGSSPDCLSAPKDWTISSRPPALLPPTLSRNRRPVPRPSPQTSPQMPLREGSRSPRSANAPALAQSPPSRKVQRNPPPSPPSQTGSSVPLPHKTGRAPPPIPPPLHSSGSPTPPLPTKGATPPQPPTGSAPPLPPLPAKDAPPPPQPATTGSAPLPPLPAKDAPPSPQPPTGSATPLPPLPAKDAPPPPPAGNAPPPPPPPPPVGGSFKKMQSSPVLHQSAPLPSTTPTNGAASSGSQGNLLAGINSIKLKKAPERPVSEQPSKAPAKGKPQGIMSEIKGFKLRKTVIVKTKSADSDLTEQTDSNNPPPPPTTTTSAFHVKLKPIKSLPVTTQSTASPPPPVKNRLSKALPMVQPRHQRKSDEDVISAGDERGDVPEWKRALQERKLRKSSAPVQVCPG